MALEVEDGTGVAGADSYAEVADATAYWADRPQDALAATWTDAAGVDGKQEGALREATAYLDATWGQMYRGVRATAAQGLLWPRIDRTALGFTACITTVAELEAAQALTDKPLLGLDGLELPGLPTQIVNATIELAARACIARLASDVDPSAPWIKREKVGSLETEYGGAGPAVPGGSYGFVDGILAGVLIGTRNGQWNWA